MTTKPVAPTPDSIETEYHRLGHTLGWRFLTCPEANIDKASVALITINPAGDRFEKARWSVEDGSAYVVESWKGRAPGQENLQRQVRRMFEVMGIDSHRVLSGYLVPFRSPDWDLLSFKTDSLDFGIGLWRQVFERACIRTVVAFGKETAPHIRRLLMLGSFQSSPRIGVARRSMCMASALATGWSSCPICRGFACSDGPHLRLHSSQQ